MPRPELRSRGVPLALGAVLLLLCGLSACGGGGSDDAVARVGESPITKATVDHWLSVLAGGRAADASSAQYRAQRAPLVSFLISSRWLLAEAADADVNVKDSEAEARLEVLGDGQDEAFRSKGLPGHEELSALFAKARRHSDRLWLMKLAILASRLEEKRVAELGRQITPTEIASYYDSHKSMFVSPERRDVEWIVVYSDAVLQKAVQEIRAGKNFVSVAARVSQDSPMIYGMVRHPAAEKKLAARVFSAKPHVLLGPFRQTENRYVFEVTKIIPARQQTLAQARIAIVKRLAAKQASTGFAAALAQRWKERTRCQAGYLVAGCRGYVGVAS